MKKHKLLSTFLVLLAVSTMVGADSTSHKQPNQKVLNRALLSASAAGDLDKTKSLLSRGASANFQDDGGKTPLMMLVWRDESPLSRDSLSVLKLLLSRHPNVNAQNFNGMSALIIASSWSQTEAVKLLVKHGAQVNLQNNDGQTALMNACYGSGEGNVFASPDIVRHLLRHGADPNKRDNDGSTALINATKLLSDPISAPSPNFPKEHRQVAAITRMLIARGADVNARTKNGNTALKWAKMNRHWAAVKLLQRAGAHQAAVPAKRTAAEQRSLDNALLYAVENGRTGRARALLKRGASVNAQNGRGDRPIIMAAYIDETPYQYGPPHSMELFQLVMVYHPDVNVKNKEGVTALHMAALARDDDAVRMLVKRGASINAKNDSGWTPLMLACYSQTEGDAFASPSIVRFLLRRGAKVDERNDNGDTALLLANQLSVDLQAYKTEISHMLIARGADVNTRNRNGNTALKWAKVNGNPALIRLLEHAGARQ
ncbi:hypothetical protein EON80_03670 [bacterium]|nr:MAG: hypothetical protein EON80_03670 [bacterium]